MPTATTTEELVARQSGGDVIVQIYAQQVERALDEWQARIDELIQQDLTHLDIRGEALRPIDAMQNVHSAARSRLTDACGDSGADLDSLLLGLEQLMRDLRDAYGAAEEAVGRGRGQSPIVPDHR